MALDKNLQRKIHTQKHHTGEGDAMGQARGLSVVWAGGKGEHGHLDLGHVDTKLFFKK